MFIAGLPPPGTPAAAQIGDRCASLRRSRPLPRCADRPPRALPHCSTFSFRGPSPPERSVFVLAECAYAPDDATLKAARKAALALVHVVRIGRRGVTQGVIDACREAARGSRGVVKVLVDKDAPVQAGNVNIDGFFRVQVNGRKVVLIQDGVSSDDLT
eukprot:tig00021123_g18511.t1